VLHPPVPAPLLPTVLLAALLAIAFIVKEVKLDNYLKFVSMLLLDVRVVEKISQTVLRIADNILIVFLAQTQDVFSVRSPEELLTVTLTVQQEHPCIIINVPVHPHQAPQVLALLLLQEVLELLEPQVEPPLVLNLEPLVLNLEPLVLNLEPLVLNLEPLVLNLEPLVLNLEPLVLKVQPPLLLKLQPPLFLKLQPLLVFQPPSLDLELHLWPIPFSYSLFLYYSA